MSLTVEKIESLIERYQANYDFYRREHENTKDVMFWASYQRCDDILCDLKLLLKTATEELKSNG